MARRKACRHGDANRSLHFSWDAETEAKLIQLFFGESEQFLAPSSRSSGETLHVQSRTKGLRGLFLLV